MTLKFKTKLNYTKTLFIVLIKYYHFNRECLIHSKNALGADTKRKHRIAEKAALNFRTADRPLKDPKFLIT